MFLKFRTRHGSIASVLAENYRTAMAMLGLSDDRRVEQRPLDSIEYSAVKYDPTSRRRLCEKSSDIPIIAMAVR